MKIERKAFFPCDASVTADMIKHNQQKETDPIVRRIKKKEGD